jgi:PKD domain
MRPWIVGFCSLLFAGCNAMEPTPVAPSAVLPDAPSTGPRLPTYTAFDVRLTNGTTYAIADSPWLGILSVLPHEGALITAPRRVTADCGNGVVTELGTGIGTDIRFSCRWARSGDVVVRAVVEAQNGVTTSAQLPLHVEPPIVVVDVVTVEIAVSPGAPDGQGQPWTFTPTTTGPAVSLTWDFGDGSPTLTNGPNAPMTHRYQKNGVYVVTATARLQDGSIRPSGRTEILVSAL